MERVATLDGVIFYNDSKATNVDAATCALNAFAHQPVVLIAGGKDKMTPLEDFVQLVKHHCVYVVLLGEAAERFATAFQEGGYDEVVFPLLDFHITNGNGGKSRFELLPVFSSVHREEYAKFSSCKKKVFVYIILL